MPIGAHTKAHKGEKMLIIAVSKIFDDNVHEYSFQLSTIKDHILKLQSLLYNPILIHFSDSSICQSYDRLKGSQVIDS